MPKVLPAILVLLLVLAGAFMITRNETAEKMEPVVPVSPNSDAKKESPLAKIKKDIMGVDQYLIEKKFNTSCIFYIDMSMPSHRNRFFVYDLKQENILHEGLVTHGRCNEYWLKGRKYSNVTGSGCTSLGRYKIGASYKGRFGLAFKLHGIDSSNNNAYKRYVVLHGHECVPENEVDYEICQSDGCPTVAPGYLNVLKGIINSSQKPVLLWIVN